MNIDILCEGIIANILILQDEIRKNPRDHRPVINFQEALTLWLDKNSSYKWIKEKKDRYKSWNDRIDIFGAPKRGKTGSNWIIEIDATRGDQVAKKMLSRFALWGLDDKKPTTYIALLYPDSQNGRNESKKFIHYGNKLLKSINDKSRVIGIIVGKQYESQFFVKPGDNYIEIYDPDANVRFNIDGGVNPIVGMPGCAQEAILMYAKNNSIHSYADLDKVFGKYIEDNASGSRPNKTNLILNGKTVYTYSQFRHYENWDAFVKLCSDNGINIEELSCFYKCSKKKQYSISPLPY